MIEPLLEVSVPDELVIVGKHRRGGEYGENVILLQELFGDLTAQERLVAVCRLFSEQANVRLLAVEGADTAVTEAPVAGTLPQLVSAAVSVSSGVLFLIQEDPGRFEVAGVDDMDSNSRSRDAMTRLMFAEPARETAFDGVRPLLGAAQKRWYRPGVAELRNATLRVLRAGALSGMPLARRVELIAQEAAGAGVDTRAFPGISGYLTIREIEDRLDPRRAERQNKEFLERLVDRLFGWAKQVGNQVEIDPAAALPIVEYWCERIGVSRAELEARVRGEGWAPVLLELKQWLDTWLVAEAQRLGAHSGAGRRHEFDEELMRLALRVGVKYFDLHDFRDAVSMSREYDKVKATLAEEMPDAVGSILGRLEAPEAARLRDLEDRIDMVYRALLLELPPEDAEIADVQASRLISSCDELAELAGAPLSAAARGALSELEPHLEQAALFLELSLRRGRHMASRTLELMRERGEDRAILVAGGFHERTITRQIETERDVSWSVLAPRPGDVSGATTLPSLLGAG